jgi:ubiquinone/menaquinone biosynthesis C-methylase UbiE
MGNAIHILPDPDALLEEIRRVLRPKGILAFNTSFYAGTYPRGTEKFYHHWLMGALGFIARRGQELKQAGGPAIRRVRGTAARAFSRPWPARQEWCARLERKGFRVLAAHERTVMMDRRSFESVGAYAGLASVLLSGYPVELACEALQAAAAPAFAAIGATAVPRLWLEVTAITTNGESSHVD